MESTGCDAVMIGRAALSNPWIFSQIHALMKHLDIPQVTLARRFDTMKQYAAASVDQFGESIACRMMRSRLTWVCERAAGKQPVPGVHHAHQYPQ